MKADDLNAPWFVVAERDGRFHDVTGHRVCQESARGAVKTAARQSSRVYPYIYYRRRIANPSTMLTISVMAAAPALSEALAEAI